MIIIPDIHGRDFWKEAVKGQEEEEIIFLGDYVDPYDDEGLTPLHGLTTLKEVIDFKKSHPHNVTLLVGNHDMSYVSDLIGHCRHDYENQETIRQLMRDNIDLLDLCAERQFGERTVLFSHAGVEPKWLMQNQRIIGRGIKKGLAERLNLLFHSARLHLALCEKTEYRGGDDEAGSCIWADLQEHFDNTNSEEAEAYRDVYQIFGHTLQETGKPVITPHFACLDCSKAFRLDEEGRVSEL